MMFLIQIMCLICTHNLTQIHTIYTENHYIAIILLVMQICIVLEQQKKKK